MKEVKEKVPSLTQRKLIRFGKGIAITLPKGWTDYYGLKPGDTVKVKVNNRLVITINKNKKETRDASLAAGSPVNTETTNGGESTHGNVSPL